ncbi:protein NinD [Escherichia coli]
MMRCYRCGECKEDNRFRPNPTLLESMVSPV